MKQIKITIITCIKSQPITAGFQINKVKHYVISWPEESYRLEILADSCTTGDRWFLEIMEVPAQSREVVDSFGGWKLLR